MNPEEEAVHHLISPAFNRHVCVHAYQLSLAHHHRILCMESFLRSQGTIALRRYKLAYKCGIEMPATGLQYTINICISEIVVHVAWIRAVVVYALLECCIQHSIAMYTTL